MIRRPENKDQLVNWAILMFLYNTVSSSLDDCTHVRWFGGIRNITELVLFLVGLLSSIIKSYLYETAVKPVRLHLYIHHFQDCL